MYILLEQLQKTKINKKHGAGGWDSRGVVDAIVNTFTSSCCSFPAGEEGDLKKKETKNERT